MKKIIFITLLSILAIHVSASEDSQQKTETRAVTVFNEINISNAFKLVITQADNYSLKLEGDAGDLPYVEIRQSGSVLNIGMKDNFHDNNHQQIIVYVSCKELKKLQLSGACTVETTNQLKTTDFKIIANGASKLKLNFNMEELDATLNGASHISIKGKCSKATLTANGASDIEGDEFTVNEVTLHCTGASKAILHVTKSLDVHASGASSVRYSGDATVKSDVTGASSIKKI